MWRLRLSRRSSPSWSRSPSAPTVMPPTSWWRAERGLASPAGPDVPRWSSSTIPTWSWWTDWRGRGSPSRTWSARPVQWRRARRCHHLRHRRNRRRPGQPRERRGAGAWWRTLARTDTGIRRLRESRPCCATPHWPSPSAAACWRRSTPAASPSCPPTSGGSSASTPAETTSGEPNAPGWAAACWSGRTSPSVS